MERDKVFNMQITIQKLEEELSLYRNGFTGEEIKEQLKERDVEIESLKAIIAGKDDMLRKIAKSSGDVLDKYQRLLTVHSNLQAEKDDCIRKIEENNQRILILNRQSDLQSETIASLEQSLQEKEKVVQSCREESEDNNRSIEKLQARCAELISERTKKVKQLDQEKLEMVKQVQTFRDSMKASLSQRDSTVKRQDQEIRELKRELERLQRRAKSSRGHGSSSSSLTAGVLPAGAVVAQTGAETETHMPAADSSSSGIANSCSLSTTISAAAVSGEGAGVSENSRRSRRERALKDQSNKLNQIQIGQSDRGMEKDPATHHNEYQIRKPSEVTATAPAAPAPKLGMEAPVPAPLPLTAANQSIPHPISAAESSAKVFSPSRSSVFSLSERPRAVTTTSAAVSAVSITGR